MERVGKAGRLARYKALVSGVNRLQSHAAVRRGSGLVGMVGGMHGIAIIENPGRVRLIRRRLGAMPAGEIRDNGDTNAGAERERYSHGFHFRASLAPWDWRLLFVTFMNHKD